MKGRRSPRPPCRAGLPGEGRGLPLHSRAICPTPRTVGLRHVVLTRPRGRPFYDVPVRRLAALPPASLKPSMRRPTLLDERELISLTATVPFDEKVFVGPLARITRDAISFIERNYLKETVIKHPDRPEAERLWNFPLAAIEEAVVNAVYHRSYEIREPVEVRITGEDLVVLSFPGPDRSIRMDDLRAGRAVSRRYRNRRVGEFLKELDLTEGRSTGISKILKVMSANGSPLPEFETDDDRTYFLIRLPVHERAAETQGGAQVTPQVTGEVTGEVRRLLEALMGDMSERPRLSSITCEN